MPSKKPKFTDADVLAYNPWGFDESDYRVMSNRFVVTRRPSECDMCFEAIPVGTRVRSQAEIFEGKAKTFKFCPLCCEAMGRCVSHDDPDGELIKARTQLGIKNARDRREAVPEAVTHDE